MALDPLLFDGDDQNSFVLAVKVNIAHGLPLSFADGEAAAARILAFCPQWPDRVVAVGTGLAGRP